MAKRTLTDPFIRNHPAPDSTIEISDSRATGLVVRITTTGHKAFVFRYRFGDKVRRFTIGAFPQVSLKEARDEAGDLHKKIKHGIDPLAEKRAKMNKVNPQTFKELATEFQDTYLPTLRERTSGEYRRIITAYLMPWFGECALSDMTRNQIVSRLDSKAYGEGSPTMANRIRGCLSRIFTFGMERGLAEANPVASTSVYDQGTGRDRYYNPDEIRELWSRFNDLEAPTGSVFKMLLITGQRRTETMKMKWSDLQGDVWTIPAELAKNARPHDVPLSEPALEIIEGMREITGRDEYVFDFPQAGVKAAAKAIPKYSKVPDFRPHDLRRTVATYMAKLGVDRTVLGKILNHKGLAGDGQVTAIYDRHSYMDEKRRALQRWSVHLQQILSGQTQANITKIG